jgi:fluoride ion exporter CrcB/FEX
MLVSGQWVHALWALALGTELSMASFAVGTDAATACQVLAISFRSRKHPRREDANEEPQLRRPGNSSNMHINALASPHATEHPLPSTAAHWGMTCTPQRTFAFWLFALVATYAVLLAMCVLAYVKDANWSRRTIYLSCIVGPAGALLRWQLAELLNGKIPCFPLGTFLANTIASAADAGVEAVVLVLALRAGARSGAEVAIGGFAGALSTVSTWVGELSGLREAGGSRTVYAYIYGAASLIVAQAVGVAVLGGTVWAKGLSGKNV